MEFKKHGPDGKGKIMKIRTWRVAEGQVPTPHFNSGISKYKLLM